MFKKVQLYNFIFDLTFNEDNIIVASNFNVEGKRKGQFSEDDLRAGHLLQQEIFDGKYNWLIKKDGMVTLPTHNILITLNDPIYDGSVKYGGGSIASNLKETCPYCQDTDCHFDCDQSQYDDEQETEEGANSRRDYNYACDAIESMVVAHAVAGVDVESAAYLEGLEAAIDAVANNL